MQFFVNGDIRPFHAAWNELSQFIRKMYESDNAANLPPVDGLIKMLKWKMSVIAGFYAVFMKHKLIGKSVDVLSFEPTKPKN